MNDLSYTVKSREQNKLSIIRAACAIIAAIAALLGAAAVFLCREEPSRYLNSSPATYAFYLAIALGVVCAVACLFLFKSGTTEQSERPNLAQRIFGIVAHAALLIAAFTVITSDAPTVIKAIVIISSLMGSFMSNESGNVNSALAGAYAKVLFCILIISMLYIDLTVEMNSPFKLMIQFAAASVALTSLCDARRIAFGISAKLSVGAKVLACVLGLSSGAVTIVGAIFKGGLVPTQYLIYSAYFTAEAIRAIVSLFGSRVALSDSI